jgi:glycosyltransferase involved in cell wall biosynthesis
LIEDDALRQKLGRQGREYVEENFSWRKKAEEIIDVYEEVLGD